MLLPAGTCSCVTKFPVTLRIKPVYFIPGNREVCESQTQLIAASSAPLGHLTVDPASGTPIIDRHYGNPDL